MSITPVQRQPQGAVRRTRSHRVAAALVHRVPVVLDLDGVVLQPGVERADGREAQRHQRDPHLASGARTGMDRGGRGTAVSLENVSSATQL